MPHSSAPNIIATIFIARLCRSDRQEASTTESESLTNSEGCTVSESCLIVIQFFAPSCQSPMTSGSAMKPSEQIMKNTFQRPHFLKCRMNTMPHSIATSPAAI